MSDFYSSMYNPDVLTCLANLSNDEVFTPPEVANRMLDMLPEEIWHDSSVTFLEPACKSGVFLREIAKRLIDGLKEEIPDLQERIDHIFHKQLYGIAITELTSLLSRRSVYCSKYPNSRYSISHFEDTSGNIRYKRIQHRWQNGKCLFCGASRNEYERGDDLETHAYEWIHTAKPEEIFKMKFDVIIGNPPYQLNDGGNNASAIPLYQKFIKQSLKLSPRYLSMIIPSRWFSGGRGLDEFRSSMINDTHLRKLYDFENAGECFPGVDISGGVCYFLWDRQYDGPCTFVNVESENENTSTRYLNKYPILVRSNKAIPIIDKVASFGEKTLDKKVSSQKPFGLRTFVRPDDSGELMLRWNGGKGPIKREHVTSGIELINRWNVIVSRVFFEHGGQVDKNGQRRVLSVLEILKPMEVCTETYIVVDSFESETKARNLYAYLQTCFARFLILQATSSIMITRNCFIFVPIQDFSERWTDEKLYAKYGLTKDEIDFIESMIKPMEAGGDDDGN